MAVRGKGLIVSWYIKTVTNRKKWKDWRWLANEKSLVYDQDGRPVGMKQGHVIGYYHGVYQDSPFSNLYYSKVDGGFPLYFNDNGEVNGLNNQDLNGQTFKYTAHFHSVEQVFAFAKAFIFAQQAKNERDRQTNHKLMQQIYQYQGTDMAVMRKFGRQVAGFDPEIWNQYADSWMQAGMESEIKADPYVFNTLSQYQDYTFLEASPSDGKWGGKISVLDDDLEHFEGENRQGAYLKASFNSVLDMFKEADRQAQAERAAEEAAQFQRENEASDDPSRSIGMFQAGGLKATDDLNYTSAAIGDAGYETPQKSQNTNSKKLTGKPYVLALTGGSPFFGQDKVLGFDGQSGLYKDNAKIYSMNPMKIDASGNLVNDSSSPWLQTELKFEEYLQKQFVKHGSLEIHSSLQPGADMMWALAAVHVRNTLGSDKVHLVVDQPYQGNELEATYGPRSDMKRDYGNTWLAMGKENREIYKALLAAADQVNTYGDGKDAQEKSLLVDKSRQAMLKSADEVINFDSNQADHTQAERESKHFGTKLTNVYGEDLGFDYRLADGNEPSAQPEVDQPASESQANRQAGNEPQAENTTAVNEQDPSLPSDDDVPPLPSDDDMPPEDYGNNGIDETDDLSNQWSVDAEHDQPQASHEQIKQSTVEQTTNNQPNKNQQSEPGDEPGNANTDRNQDQPSNDKPQSWREQLANFDPDSVYSPKNRVTPGKVFTMSHIGHNPQDMRNALARADREANQSDPEHSQNWAHYLSYSKQYEGRNKNDQYLMAEQLRYEKEMLDELQKHGQLRINCTFGAGTETAFTRAAIAVKHKNRDKVKLVGFFAGPTEFVSRNRDSRYREQNNKQSPFDSAAEETKLMLNEMDSLNLYSWVPDQNGVAKLHNKPLIKRTSYDKNAIQHYLHGDPSLYDQGVNATRKLAKETGLEYALPRYVHYQLEHDAIDSSHELIVNFDQNPEKKNIEGKTVIGRNNKPLISTTGQLLAYAQKKRSHYKFSDQPQLDDETFEYKSEREVTYQDPNKEPEKTHLQIKWLDPVEPAADLDLINDPKMRRDYDPQKDFSGKGPNVWNVRVYPIGTTVETGGVKVKPNLLTDQPKYRAKVLENFKKSFTADAPGYHPEPKKPHKVLPQSEQSYQESETAGDHQIENDLKAKTNGQPERLSEQERQNLSEQANKEKIKRQTRRNKEQAADQAANQPKPKDKQSDQPPIYNNYNPFDDLDK